MPGSPIVLDAIGAPYENVISAHRDGEPDFTWVQGIGDAIMAALNRGVDLIVPPPIFDQLRDDFPPDLPSYIKVR